MSDVQILERILKNIDHFKSTLFQYNITKEKLEK